MSTADYNNENFDRAGYNIALTSTVFDKMLEMGTFYGGIIRNSLQQGYNAIRDRRQIIREELWELEQMDTNAKSNTGYIVVTGITIIALIGYKIYRNN